MKKSELAAFAFVGGLLLGTWFSARAERPGEAVRGDDRLVTGIGGVFFKARDPAAMRRWYRVHLGVAAGPNGADFLWRHWDDPRRPGRTVWNIFPRDSEYFGSDEQQFMVNYRVADLDSVLSELESAGINPVKGPEGYPYGRFAWIEDGEGNRIELWEPNDI